KKPQMIAEQLFEVLRILNSFEIKSDRISAECGLKALQAGKPINPYQGLKRSHFLGIPGPRLLSRKTHKSLSGIETILVRFRRKYRQCRKTHISLSRA
ncbi:MULTISPECIES: hypothetical protein, partial [unclassified Microcoleus]|uniref:hypothetical protein n=1 Tax=unclassified Microcoleus TaxID=2642155 RepID=UPI0025FC0B8E